jgi:hypothetical protein
MAKSRYAVKSATLTFGSKTYEMANGPAMKSETRDAVEITSLEDTVKNFIPGALKEINEFSVTLFQKGLGEDLSVDNNPAVLTIEVCLSNGVDEDKDASYEFGTVIITAVSAPEVDAAGDRKATYTVTFRPTGDHE